MDSLASEEVKSVRSRIHAEVLGNLQETFEKSEGVILEIGPALRTSIHTPHFNSPTVIMVEREIPKKDTVEVIFPGSTHPGLDEKYKMYPNSAEATLDFLQTHPEFRSKVKLILTTAPNPDNLDDGLANTLSQMAQTTKSPLIMFLEGRSQELLQGAAVGSSRPLTQLVRELTLTARDHGLTRQDAGETIGEIEEGLDIKIIPNTTMDINLKPLVFSRA